MNSGELRKIRTLIVDDEPLARSNLNILLRHDSEVEMLAESGSGQDAIVTIRSQKPELLFLDVQMPECDGFDLLEALGKNLPPAIVFVTAFDEYAIRAFEAGAIDYLLKPFDDARFERTLRRAKERILQSRIAARGLDRLAIKDKGQIVFVDVSEIDWIEAADYYSCLHVGPKSYLLRRSMTELEQDLNAQTFCRVHRSAIINLERVRALESNAEGESEVVLQNNVRLPLSRRHRKQVQAKLSTH